MKFIDEILDAVGLYEEEEIEEVVPPARESKPAKPERKNPFVNSQKQEAKKSYKEAIAVVEDDEEEDSKSLFSFPFFKKKKEKEEASAPQSIAAPEVKEEPRKPFFPRRNLEKANVTQTPTPVAAPVAKKTAAVEEDAKKPSFIERLRNRSGASEKEDGNKAMPIMINNREINVMVIEPASFDDCPKIADYLRNNQPVILNFDRLDPLVAKRMGDFICGSVYAINGSMKKLGRTVLICAPRNVEIDAAEKYDVGEEGWKR
mgnify:FL=1